MPLTFPPGFDPLGEYVGAEEMRRQATPKEETGDEGFALPQPPFPRDPVLNVAPYDIGEESDLVSYDKVWPASGPAAPIDVRTEAADYWQTGVVILKATNDPVQIVGGQPQRTRAVLVVTGAGAVMIGAHLGDMTKGTTTNPSTPQGYTMDPLDPPLELRHKGEVWVSAVADTTLSYFVELNHETVPAANRSKVRRPARSHVERVWPNPSHDHRAAETDLSPR